MTKKKKSKSENTEVHRLVPCPTCRKSLEYSTDNPYRPFCSERCRIQDRAAWATDGYAIPGEPIKKSDEEDLDES